MNIKTLLHRMWHFGCLALPEQEMHYRQQNLPDDISRMRILISLTLVPILVFIVSDYHHAQGGSFFYVLLGLRILALTASLILLGILRQSLSVFQFDLSASAWTLLLIYILIVITFTRPSDFTMHSMFNIMVIFGIYLALPLPFVVQVISAVLITGSEVVVFAFFKEPQTTTVSMTLLVTYFVTNAVGIIASCNFSRAKRAQFASLESEREAKESLKEALTEIKTLRGLILICQECNRVLDDDGHWEQVEAYVRNHTHAEFSHGICLDCAETRHIKSPAESQSKSAT